MSDKILSHLFSVSDSDILMCVCVVFTCGTELLLAHCLWPRNAKHRHSCTQIHVCSLPCKSFNPYICGALLSYTVVVTCVSLPVLFGINL